MDMKVCCKNGFEFDLFYYVLRNRGNSKKPKRLEINKQDHREEQLQINYNFFAILFIISSQ